MTLENTPPPFAAGAVGAATTSAAEASVSSTASFFMLTTVRRGSIALHEAEPLHVTTFRREAWARTIRSGGAMRQRGQVLELKTTASDGLPLWAYRYRPDGRDSKRLQRGGFASAEAARVALEHAITRAEHRRLHSRAITLAELADEYLAQHDAQPETSAKLRWLLSKSVCVFGTRPIAE